MTSKTSIALATASLALLSACGGGGGDSAPAVAPNTVTITSTNQSAVARATVAGGFSIAQAQTADAGGRAHAQAVGGARAPAGVGAVDKALRLALASFFDSRKNVASASAGAGVRPATASTTSEPCVAGGTRATTIDDVDNNSKISVGDVVTVTFAQCRDTSSLYDGSLAVTVSSAPNGQQIAGTAAFGHLSVTDGTVTTTIAGSVGVTETDTGSEADVTLTIGAGGLSVSATSPTYTDSIAFDAGMAIVTTDQYNADQMTVTLNGSFTASSIGGRVTLQTLQPIVEHSTDLFPTSGQVRVTGANGGKLLLTIASTTQVELQLDAAGDGTYEGDVFVDWTTLLPQ